MLKPLTSMRALLFLLAVFLVVESSWATLPMPLARFVENRCASLLLAGPTEVRQLAQQINAIDAQELSPSERKALFRLAVGLKVEAGTRNPWVSDERILEIIGMRLKEVSGVIWRLQSQEPRRFGNEYTWAGENGMATMALAAFHEMFRNIPLKAGDTVVDIGAGFGKLGIYLAITHPGVKFIGYEIVPERVAEFDRVAVTLELGNDVQMITQDLSEPGFNLALADYYYSWQPVNTKTGAKLWQDLEKKGRQYPFSFIYYGLPGGSPGDFGFKFSGGAVYDSAKKKELSVGPQAKKVTRWVQ